MKLWVTRVSVWKMLIFPQFFVRCLLWKELFYFLVMCVDVFIFHSYRRRLIFAHWITLTSPPEVLTWFIWWSLSVKHTATTVNWNSMKYAYISTVYFSLLTTLFGNESINRLVSHKLFSDTTYTTQIPTLSANKWKSNHLADAVTS